MKLVRDMIPQIIEESGEKCKYHIAKDNEYAARLYSKMMEELIEFREEPCLEEAADMWEVLLSICTFHKFDMQDVFKAASEKRSTRGGFEDRIILHQKESGTK